MMKNALLIHTSYGRVCGSVKFEQLLRMRNWLRRPDPQNRLHSKPLSSSSQHLICMYVHYMYVQLCNKMSLQHSKEELGGGGGGG